MEYVFEIIDKTKREIRLTKRQWRHITKVHPNMTNYLDEIKETLINPLKITDYSLDNDVRYYYKYLKYRKFTSKYLCVIIKYLNGEGFIISAFFEKYIK